MHPLLDPSPEVSQALSLGQPVVALETTIVAHGLPPPWNLESARQAEAVIREAGAVPATVGVLNGKVKVGLNDSELECFASREGIDKVSRRDLSALVASGQAGATTVAATMAIAALAGIRFQATGGIGGVHRGGESSLDISADLLELSRSPVAVVCSGPKVVLDIGRTLEVLETLGVPVVGYRTSQCPAFYCRDGGHPLVHRADSPGEAARLARVQWELGLGGLVFANPVAKTRALDPERLEAEIQRAQDQAERRGITGKDLTPALLKAIASAYGQACLEANRTLYLDNARLAAQMARSYCDAGPA